MPFLPGKILMHLTSENVNRNKADTGILLLLSSAFHLEEYRFVCGFHSQPSASFEPAQRPAQRGGRQDGT